MQAAAPPIAPIAGGDELRDGHANDDAEGATAAPPGFVIDPALATSLGLDEETRRALLGSFGFRAIGEPALQRWRWRSEEHTSELQSLMRNSYAVFCLKNKKISTNKQTT